MGVYLDFIKKTFQQNYVYRFNLFMGVFGTFLNLFVRVSIWWALYRVNPVVKGVTFDDMINFIIIDMIVSALVRSNIADNMADKVRDGSIAMDFIKPISLKLYFFSEQLGRNIFYSLFSVLPVSITAALLLGFKLLESAQTFMLFILSAVLGMVLMYYINYILGLLAFWLKTSYYSRWFLSAFFSLFGGSVIPLWFYPKPLYALSVVFPFRFVSFEPISIYLGKYSAEQSLTIVLAQLVWISAFIILERYIWHKAQKLIIVHGG